MPALKSRNRCRKRRSVRFRGWVRGGVIGLAPSLGAGSLGSAQEGGLVPVVPKELRSNTGDLDSVGLGNPFVATSVALDLNRLRFDGSIFVLFEATGRRVTGRCEDCGEDVAVLELRGTG